MNRRLSLVAAIVILSLSIATLVVRHGAGDVLKRAADALKKEPSYRTEFSVTTNAQATFALTLDGAVDTRTKVGEFTMRFTYPGSRGLVSCAIITTPNAVYVPIAGKDRARFGGKAWVRSSVAGLIPIQGFGTKGFDPTSFANIDHLRETGTGTVRGFATTTYGGTLHIDRSQLAQSTLSTEVPSEVPVVLWISSDGLIRKLEDSFPRGS